jgi:NitT/TauT family transport system substrate-binding protein
MKRPSIAGLACFVVASMCTTFAHAQSVTKIRVGNFSNTFVLPLFNGIEKGYFKEADLDVEIIPYQTGPGVVSAVAGGEVDVAWSAAIPPILARSRGIPVKIFLSVAAESQPDHLTQWIVATAKSGISSMKDIKGKTVMINANGGGCELAPRDRLSAEGLDWNDIKRVVVPFPQMQAALELGNADAVCTIDPFYTSIMDSKEIGAKVIAPGVFSKTPVPLVSNNFFALETWLKANREAAIRFGKAYEKSKKDVETDSNRRAALAVKYLGLAPDLAAKVDLSSWRDTPVVSLEAVKPTIDAMLKGGLLKTPMAAEQVVETLAY